MKYHYKAFISYRHAELDTKVAVEIQNRIERCFIPRSIRRDLGIKSIGRVFRDKDELPSTSDLNDNIKNAIRNSEYLICICSPRYIESIWGRKEIELFLESHDKQHVLTVLAEGEPNEVIPDILRSERVTVRDENGNDVTIETKLEPLSCDYRGDRHTARTEEFPRLAAVLIGCSYADLRQKMRRRRMRMVTAAAVLASALAAYFIWSYINIQVNYRQSLINQSRYLASSAQEAIDNNDNMLAAQLSLAALPDQGRNRPVVPEAVYTLSQAIGAYQSKQTLNIREVASYAMETGTLKEAAVTSDAHYMAMLSYGGDVDVFDLVENRKLYTISTSGLFGKELYSLTVCGNDRILIYGSNYVVMIRFSDGVILWHQQFKGFYGDIIALGENDVSSLLFLDLGEVLIVSAENGEILNRFMIGDVSGGEATSAYGDDKSSYIYVEDTENACFSILGKEIDDTAKKNMVTGVLTYYYETGRSVWTPFNQEYYCFEDIYRAPDGRILLIYAEEERDSIANHYHRFSENSVYAKIKGEKVNLVLLKEGTGEVLWQNSIEYMGVRDISDGYFDIRTIPAEDGHPTRQVVLAAVSNKIVLFDADSGSKIKDSTLLDEVVSVNQQNEKDSFIRVSGASGTLYEVNYHSEEYTVIKYMEGPVDKSFFIHSRLTYDGVSCIVVHQGNTIRMFKVGQGDDEFKAFGFEKPEEGLYSNYFFGTRLVMINMDKKIYIYDLESEKKLYEIELDSEKNYKYVGCAEDNSCFYMKTINDYPYKTMLRVDLDEGTFETVDITLNDFLTGAGKWEFGCNYCVVSGDYIFYRAVNYNSMTSYWFRYSMKEGSCAMLALPYYEDNPSTNSDVSKCLFAQDGTKGVFYFDNTIYLADFGSGAVKAVDSEIPGVTFGTRRESDGMFAFYYEGSKEGDDRKELHVYDAGGEKRWKIDNLAEQISVMRFYGDRLIVATMSNRLYAYDARTGRRIGMIELNADVLYSSMEIYEDSNGNLIIDNDGGTVLMVDDRNWALTGVANNARYCPALKWIISFSNWENFPIGYFRYYSVSELVEKGKAFVGEQKMSETDKAKFGLN